MYGCTSRNVLSNKVFPSAEFWHCSFYLLYKLLFVITSTSFFSFFSLCVAAQDKITGVATGSDNLPFEGASVINTANVRISVSCSSFIADAKIYDVLEISSIGLKQNR